MTPFTQYPEPDYTLVHLSDTHFLGDRAALFGSVDTDRGLAKALDRLRTEIDHADLVVVTGDVADLGEPDAYDRVAAAVEPTVAELGAELLWVMGNHDERPAFSARLWGAESAEPLHRVLMLGGLRVIALDSTVPGYHHGELGDDQLAWLAEVLAEPAPDGTVLALHHPPLPTRVKIMGLVELRAAHRLAEVITGTDVRAILAGHLHYSTFGTFAGVPVSVAAASCYTIDPLPGAREFIGVDTNHAFSLVDVFSDRIVHSVVPIDSATPVTGHSPAAIAELAAMSPDERDQAFSRKSVSPAPELDSDE
ncbi:phosphodiesterase [Microlunatus speluncae]|uniref:phosphodiesterase n=1 Tax=Microlunatus speluncae TaxID=2594267 RepID=UPI0012661354|nr:phosphodiesterase [Microlunatus speluncae]